VNSLSLFFAGLALAVLPAAAQITAAVAASVQFPMEELQADFRKSSGADVKAVYGASGKLTAQIRNGAPFDVFVSADMDFPDSLATWGFAAGKPHPYAYGKLVLWTVKEFDPALGLAALAKPGLAKIALADPQLAPYGREALKALQQAGVYPAIKDKLVYGESIAQVNQYILLGAVDVGITAESAVRAGDMRGKGKWAEVDSSRYAPIAQGAVICKHGSERNPALSAEFLAYLYSPSARAVWAKYGYALP
jgi:molybdate transport system substrate-binding protein